MTIKKFTYIFFSSADLMINILLSRHLGLLEFNKNIVWVVIDQNLSLHGLGKIGFITTFWIIKLPLKLVLHRDF
jgi:hypothetical protein